MQRYWCYPLRWNLINCNMLSTGTRHIIHIFSLFFLWAKIERMFNMQTQILKQKCEDIETSLRSAHSWQMKFWRRLALRRSSHLDINLGSFFTSYSFETGFPSFIMFRISHFSKERVTFYWSFPSDLTTNLGATSLSIIIYSRQNVPTQNDNGADVVDVWDRAEICYTFMQKLCNKYQVCLGPSWDDSYEKSIAKWHLSNVRNKQCCSGDHRKHGDDTDSDFYRPIETAKNLAENLWRTKFY